MTISKRLKLTISLTFLAINLKLILPAQEPSAQPQSFEKLAGAFTGRIHPILTKNCLVCHSTEKMEGDLDLERFQGLAEIRKEPEIWRHALEQMTLGEMPPKNRKKLSPEELNEVTTWIKEYIRAEALANAGDPGPVLVRRLTNVEFDNTIRDLTGVDLKPTREFPADGAAGEGFSNVGDALVMSPALLEKYMGAAKEVASHLVLTPTGTRFSPYNSRADWTNELLGEIKAFYRARTDPEGHTRVQLQGLEWDTNSGGRIPLSHYLTATIALRDAGTANSNAIEAIAIKEKLSPKYLTRLWQELHRADASPVLSRIQARWQSTKPDSVQQLALEIQNWQKMLTKFGSVGHFKQWLGANDPLVKSLSVAEKLQVAQNQTTTELILGSIDYSQSAATGELVWNQPRLEKPGAPTILLNDLPQAVAELQRLRAELKRTELYLNAIDEVRSNQQNIENSSVLKDQSLDLNLLKAWANVIGIDGAGAAKPAKLMLDKMNDVSGYNFVSGWGSAATPIAIANASDQLVRVPGIMKPHSVAVHPSPGESVAVIWTSPISSTLNISATVSDAHGDCGNGVSWSLELRKGLTRRILSAGVADTSKPNVIPAQNGVKVDKGTVVALVIGPLNREHTCDLTEVDLNLEDTGDQARRWSLSGDVSPNIQAGNPHADRLGNSGVWAFSLEPVTADTNSEWVVIPAGSKLDQWISEENPENRRKLAAQVQSLFNAPEKAIPAGSADALLMTRLNSLQGPLFSSINLVTITADKKSPDVIRSKAGASVKFEVPAEWAEGRTFLATVEPAGAWAEHDAAQVVVQQSVKAVTPGLNPAVPLLCGSDAAVEFWKKSFVAFRDLFPGALCYPQIVPVDEVVTVALFHREDENLSRLMLSDTEKQHLDRLWDELWYVSQEPLKVEVGYKQFMEYVTQDGDVRLFEPLRQPIKQRAELFRKQLEETREPQFESVLKVVDRAWRRPLTDQEKQSLRALYNTLLKQDLPHDQAVRLVLVRGLLSPAFLYRLEPTLDQSKTRALNDWELASRLSYFIWSSLPDAQLRSLADKGELHRPEVLTGELRRMLKGPKSRALATEFACQWLHLKDFNTLNEKSEKIFPEFAELRGPMYEEVVLFFTDFFQNNRPLSEILESDRTFVNESLARFYEIDGIQGDKWQAKSGMRAAGRGGLLGFAALTARQAGASRTSPILRGNWLLETLLGEKLPRPPKNVPQLPESELDTNGLTVRQITEKHRADPACAKCHDRIDAFGMSLEAFDAIGRLRTADLAGRKIDAAVEMPDGTKFEGIDGLRSFLMTNRKNAIYKQFHKKLMGYALGRSVMVSDDPLIEKLDQLAETPGKGVQDAIELIVTSPQFLNQRGLQADLMTE